MPQIPFPDLFILCVTESRKKRKRKKKYYGGREENLLLLTVLVKHLMINECSHVSPFFPSSSHKEEKENDSLSKTIYRKYE